MKKFIFFAAIAGITFVALAASKSQEPIIMTVNGVDVPKSEFEYLYHKNNSQQVQPQSIDEYVDMFVNYKLKVADARAEGLDTMSSYKDEFGQYKFELAEPYMVDNSVMDSLVNDAYSHYIDDVYVSHIMLPQSGSAEENMINTAKLDSIRADILAGRTTFEEEAAKHSVDRGSSQNGGRMGWVIPGRYPWSFEKASFDTPVGQISEVVATSAAGRPIGLHLIRVEERRPSKGEVLVQHILKLTRGKNDEQKAAAKAQIDSIYNILVAGADFSEVAKTESEDPGSARNGGMLDWFGSGMMVPEFDAVAFTLNDGEISKPFETAFGYHIIHRIDHRGVRSIEEMRDDIVNIIKGDERGLIPEKKQMERQIAKYKSHINNKGIDGARKIIESNGGYDSVAIAALKVCKLPIVTVAGKDYPVSDVMEGVSFTLAKDVDNAMNMIKAAAQVYLEHKTREAAIDDLYKEVPEYRNLLNEYSDGILLFEVSNRKVWDKAAKDTEGLEKFFNKHRADYTWDAPRFKSYIVFAANDSICQLAKEFTETLTDVTPETISKEMRERFGKDVKVERVIAPKGKNVITDYLAFGGEKPSSDASRWPCYFDFQGKILIAPEEAADVRGAVTSDYQAELEKEWVQSLRKKYPVKIDNKVLETVK